MNPFYIPDLSTLGPQGSAGASPLFVIIEHQWPDRDWNNWRTKCWVGTGIHFMQDGCQAGPVNKSLIVFKLVDVTDMLIHNPPIMNNSLVFVFLCLLLWLTFSNASCIDDSYNIVDCLQIKAALTLDPWKVRCENLDHIFSYIFLLVLFVCLCGGVQ